MKSLKALAFALDRHDLVIEDTQLKKPSAGECSLVWVSIAVRRDHDHGNS